MVVFHKFIIKEFSNSVGLHRNSVEMRNILKTHVKRLAFLVMRCCINYSYPVGLLPHGLFKKYIHIFSSFCFVLLMLLTAQSTVMSEQNNLPMRQRVAFNIPMKSCHIFSLCSAFIQPDSQPVPLPGPSRFHTDWYIGYFMWNSIFFAFLSFPINIHSLKSVMCLRWWWWKRSRYLRMMTTRSPLTKRPLEIIIV